MDHAHAPHDDDDDGYNTPQTPPPLPLPLPLATAEKTTDTKPWVRASASFAQIHFYCKRNKNYENPVLRFCFRRKQHTIKKSRALRTTAKTQFQPPTARRLATGCVRAMCAHPAEGPGPEAPPSYFSSGFRVGSRSAACVEYYSNQLQKKSQAGHRWSDE